MPTTELKFVRHNILGFVLWPRSDKLYHSDVGDLLRRRVGGEILSAGFCNLVEGFVQCFGESESLSLGCRKDDSEALAKQLGLKVG